MAGAKMILNDSRIVTRDDFGYGLFASGLGASVQSIDSDVLTFGGRGPWPGH